jgi:hypothetical protein
MITLNKRKLFHFDIEKEYGNMRLLIMAVIRM